MSVNTPESTAVPRKNACNAERIRRPGSRAAAGVRIALLAVACLPVMVACQQNRIEGMVETIDGEALPGVAVQIVGQSHHALTTALGRYTINYQPGELTLRYLKSGYTPGEMRLSVETPRLVQAQTIRLWRLPPDQGVFLYADRRYTAADPVIPERFVTKEGVVFGTKKQAFETQTTDPGPMIVTFTTRRQGLSLTRLERRTITLTGEGVLETNIDAWVPERGIPSGTAPIDEPERVLLQVMLSEPLEPGGYAVHYGALEGRSTEEPRMFLFEVLGEAEDGADSDDGADQEN